MTLDEVRVSIDRVDNEIKKLFEERMLLADQVAQVKAEKEDDIFKPEREQIIIERLTENVDESILKEYTALIKRIMEISRKYQYGRTLELRDCLDVIYKEGKVDAKTVAMLKRELYICNSCSKDSVLTVDNYDEVSKLIKEAKVDAGMGVLEEIGIKTSESLQKMLVDNNLYIYHCDIVNENGVDKKVVSFAKDFLVDEQDNRLKIMFVCKNKSGSLASVLSMIADYGINLTEIHSRSNQEAEWNYEFYVEMKANFLTKEVKALIFQLMNETQTLQILGSYRVEI